MSQNKNVVTLDFIREAANKKYANLTIEVPGAGEVTLVNAMQLPKEKRQELMDAQKRLSAAKDEAEAADGEVEEMDQVEALEDTLRIVVKGDEEKAEALIEALDGNLAVLATVFEMYTKGTELGEASASAN